MYSLVSFSYFSLIKRETETERKKGRRKEGRVGGREGRRKEGEK